MFKLINKHTKNNKGLSLVELMVTVVVMAMVLPLIGQILFQFTNIFNRSTNKWEVQGAIRTACNKLEVNEEAIVNAYQADVLYDPVVAQGITFNESTGTLSWQVPASAPIVDNADGRTTPFVMPAEGAISVDDLYTYIFSTPAYRPNGSYLGHYLFIRRPNQPNSTLFLADTEYDETPVKVEFTMGYEFEEFEKDENGKHIKDDNGKFIHRGGRSKFLDRTISVLFSSGDERSYKYELQSDYSLINTDRRRINYDAGNQLVFDPSWIAGVPVNPFGEYDVNPVGELDPTARGSIARPVAGPAGWIDLNYINKDDASVLIKDIATKTPEERDKINYPIKNEFSYEIVDKNATPPTSEIVTVQYDDAFLQQKANVMRFISPKDAEATRTPDNLTSILNPASCMTEYAFADGTKLSSHVLGGLRDFRDNVLAGTAFGDWFINQYYNVWSPALLENKDVTAPIYKVVVVPVAYICGLIANS